MKQDICHPFKLRESRGSPILFDKEINCIACDSAKISRELLSAQFNIFAYLIVFLMHPSETKARDGEGSL